MSQEAYQAEKDLNSYQAKTGRGGKNISDTGSYSPLLGYQSHSDVFLLLAQETGVDAGAENKFPGAQVRVGPGSTASGSDHRVIPPEEGGEIDDQGQ
ncbi:uncharacterized protein ARB_06489 [Trichophyton benhamiae CBS 112371]|uniref:Uncharacterized protein n=1 Tax=Arthroderma benhamiae (strain ATCC MYA-4681 / CBS 112371) TaxID=663331 RepID=D4AQI2_ARTBC|nr:uncharacterized protein ARB_06489 [Trichophyton benhamiae CBS 112371]EFE34726.1 conserved hypothetical protein [Trichophyton benhamiae CBS 112371]